MTSTLICRLIVVCAMVWSLLAGGGCSSSETATDDTLAGGEHDMTELRPLMPTPRLHQFYYYPNSIVYRDCDVDRWFWLEAGVWKFGPTLPGMVMLGGEIPIAIALESDTPYEHYEIVLSTGDPHARPVRSASEDDEGEDDEDGPGRRGRGKAKGHSKGKVRSATAEDRAPRVDD